jgi:protein-S-isoprenylcysteine O-methyltransferase Ste14
VTDIVFPIGTAVACALLAVLAVNRMRPSLQLWPTPGAGTWQSYVFWPLFRGLNVLCVVAALVDRVPFLGLPVWSRTVAAMVLLAALVLFAYSFRVLGRDNSYCATEGLVTGGIYQWTRNPQNAMLIVVYGALAVLADSLSAFVLCAAMMAVYHLMVLAEEPWLEGIYGEPYRAYCREVPRYFNWRRAWLELSGRGGHESGSLGS